MVIGTGMGETRSALMASLDFIDSKTEINKIIISKQEKFKIFVCDCEDMLSKVWYFFEGSSMLLQSFQAL